MIDNPLRRFWRWVRLTEGRRTFRAEVPVTHRDGTRITVIVEGQHAEYVAALANGIRQRYASNKPRMDAAAVTGWEAVVRSMRSGA